LNYTIDTDAISLQLRSQTDEEALFLRRLRDGVSVKLTGNVLTIAQKSSFQDDKGDTEPDKAADVEKYFEMGEGDLLTEIAEKGLDAPKKKGGKHRKEDLVDVLVKGSNG
jgi:hypothetical protein